MAMDAVGKRILVAWLAIFLFGWFLSQIGQHAYNIYYALVAEKQLSHIRDWSLLLQWSSLFEIFLTGLYFARIPRIQFTSRQYLVLSAFLIGWQVCLFHSASPVSVRSLTERFYGWQTGSEDWASFSGAYSRVITSTGDAAAFERDRVRGAYTEDELMDEYASHIAGSVTVKVRLIYNNIT